MSTKAGRFADAAEALGWTVERIKDFEGERIVKTRRGDEQYNFAWVTNDSGVLVFDGGFHWLGDESEEFTNVALALRNMAKPAQYNRHVERQDGATTKVEMVRLPFDIYNDPDTVILDRLRGQRVYWRNSISGLEENAEIPRNGQHTRLSFKRAVTFASADGGFRTVALESITKVG